jgi:hypothetical protein
MKTMNPRDNAKTSMISGDAVLYWNIKKMIIATKKLMIAGRASSFFFLRSLRGLRTCSWNVTVGSCIVFFSRVFSISEVHSTVL